MGRVGWRSHRFGWSLLGGLPNGLLKVLLYKAFGLPGVAIGLILETGLKLRVIASRHPRKPGSQLV
jgi:hypothetical protein